MKTFKLTIFALLIIASTAAAQVPTVTIHTTTAPDRERPGEWHEIITATWPTDAWEMLNDYDMELWLVSPPRCYEDGTCDKARIVRWQSTPAGRGVMVVEGNAEVERAALRFKMRELATGLVVDVGAGELVRAGGKGRGGHVYREKR